MNFKIDTYPSYLTQEKGEQSQDDKISATGEIRQLIQLKSGGNYKKNNLHSNGHHGANAEMVFVPNLDRHSLRHLS